MGRETGLNDKFGTPITDGCIVEIVRSIIPFETGTRLMCVWNVPNHRYGFQVLCREDQRNPSLRSSESIYLTPKSASKLKVV